MIHSQYVPCKEQTFTWSRIFLAFACFNFYSIIYISTFGKHSCCLLLLSLLLIELVSDAMKLIGIAFMLSFYGCFDAAPSDTIPQRNVFMEEVKWTTWKQSNNTKFSPEIFLSTPDTIKRAGYPVESHVVMTEDGFYLTLHRIPAYLLADQGYDVWFANFRGNIYSKKHTSLSPSSLEYWDFSFHEMGVYDLPAMIKFITNMRSQQLHSCIGHSLGTTTFYVMASERPEIAGMVQNMISLGPTAFIDNMKGLFRYMTPFVKTNQKLLNNFLHGEFNVNSDIYKNYVQFFDPTFLHELFVHLIFLICGFDYEQLDYTLVPNILGHDPAGTSIKAFVHYAQVHQSGKFRKFDYGSAKNLLMYNSVEPPDYDLTKITVPIALLYASNDLVADPVDVKRLYDLLPNVIDMYEVPWPKFNHADFIWAKDVAKLVYERIFQILRGENSHNVTSIL
ncbi:lipase 3-like isoform X2 [Nylanderia fulva]|uniref:lipase 3-like isoform X2 n=1 Tax=Nylanderia fulva TaxID=613905 RepID=UPI0010FB6766|nr:lipase 3-like isoform X2 [Nylanderia fulva]